MTYFYVQNRTHLFPDYSATAIKWRRVDRRLKLETGKTLVFTAYISLYPVTCMIDVISFEPLVCIKIDII